MAMYQPSEEEKERVRKGLITKSYSFRLTPTGGVQTSRKTGRKIIYKWGKDGILRPVSEVPAPCRRTMNMPRLSRGA